MKKFHIDHRNVHKLKRLLIGAGIGLVLLGFLWPPAMVAGGLLAVLAVVVVRLYWCCPHCGSGLPIRNGSIQYCPYCGKSL